MKVYRSFLTFDDLAEAELRRLLDLCSEIALKPAARKAYLADRSIALAFKKPSTRTQLSFWAACRNLGATTLAVDLDATQLSTGEPYEDTGRIMRIFVDGVVVRTNGPLCNMRALSSHGLAVINAMSACEHPTQALADYSCIVQSFGAAEGVSISYFGEGNNTLAALMKMFSRVDGCRFRAFMPLGYALPARTLSACQAAFRASRGSLEVFDHIPPTFPASDVVYCTRWQTMGAPHPDPNWRDHFMPFTMTSELLDRAATARGIFMHDLPAVRGEDVTSEVLDGRRSVAWRQAACKITGATAALVWCLAGEN
jgi:ornithine carbamoyltransferase